MHTTTNGCTRKKVNYQLLLRIFNLGLLAPRIQLSVTTYCPDNIQTLFNDFLNLFPDWFGSGLRRKGGQWCQTAQYHRLPEHAIYDAIQGISELERGYRLGTESLFAVVKIPAQSCYNNESGIKQLFLALGKLSNYARLFRCDQDLFLYIFFDTPIISTLIQDSLSALLTRQGIDTTSTNLLVHPLASFIPLPLQTAFAWLNSNSKVVAERSQVSIQSALALFLNDVRKHAVSAQFFQESIAEAEHQNVESCQQFSLVFIPVVEPPSSASVERCEESNFEWRSHLPPRSQRIVDRKVSRAPPVKIRDYVYFRPAYLLRKTSS